MSNHATLAAFNLDADGGNPEAVADAAATVLMAFAAEVRGPAPINATDEPPPGSARGYWFHPIGALHPIWIELNPPVTGAAASGLPG